MPRTIGLISIRKWRQKGENGRHTGHRPSSMEGRVVEEPWNAGVMSGDASPVMNEPGADQTGGRRLPTAGARGGDETPGRTAPARQRLHGDTRPQRRRCYRPHRQRRESWRRARFRQTKETFSSFLCEENYRSALMLHHFIFVCSWRRQENVWRLLLYAAHILYGCCAFTVRLTRRKEKLLFSLFFKDWKTTGF